MTWVIRFTLADSRYLGIVNEITSPDIVYGPAQDNLSLNMRSIKNVPARSGRLKEKRITVG